MTTETKLELRLDASDASPEGLAAAQHNFNVIKRTGWDGNNRPAWCECDAPGEEAYFRNAGTGGHGWLCGTCRGITQVG